MTDSGSFAACNNLLHRLFQCIDLAAVDEAVGLFCEDGVFANPRVELVGRQGIRDGMQQRPTDQITRHVVVTFSLNQDSADTAGGLAYIMMFRAAAQPGASQASLPPLETVGDIEAGFRREGSQWLISKVAIRPVLHG